jgi:hypothetical protein
MLPAYPLRKVGGKFSLNDTSKAIINNRPNGRKYTGNIAI